MVPSPLRALLYLGPVNHKQGSTHMAITATANSLDELFVDLNAVTRAAYHAAVNDVSDKIEHIHKLEHELQSVITDRDVLLIQVDKAEHQARKLANSESAMVQRESVRESALQTLQLKYDACVEVRDRTAVSLKEALDRIAELELIAAEHDDSTDSKNKTKFNVDDVDRFRKDSYNDGYERGKSEQLAEHMAEAVNRKPPLQAMLGHMLLSLTVRSNAPIKFRPYRIETYKSFCAKYSTDAVGHDAYTGGTVGITGLSDLSGKVLFFAESDVTSWSLEVAESPAKR